MSTLRYNWRLQLSSAALLALAVPLLVPVALNRELAPLKLAEVLWPVSAPILMAPLFSREWELGAAEVLLSRSVSRASLLGGRLVAALALLLPAYALGWLLLLALGQPLPFTQAVVTVAPGALALGAVGLAAATATRNTAAGYLVPLAWWIAELLTGGRYTRQFFLFGGEGPGKWYLVGLAAAALLAAYAALLRRDK